MEIKQKYQKIQQLKMEINQWLEAGVDFLNIKKLMLYLAENPAYFRLKGEENQLVMFEWFLNIWLTEKKKLPDLGVDTDIFYGVSCLDDIEQKYHKIEYYGWRIENAVPDEYCEQALEELIEEKVSGLAIGKIVVFETWKREENLLYIARRLRQKGDYLNALLLIQYANEKYPGQEKLLLEEADIWLAGKQFYQALELLGQIEKPSEMIKGLMAELRQVAENDG